MMCSRRRLSPVSSQHRPEATNSLLSSAGEMYRIDGVSVGVYTIFGAEMAEGYTMAVEMIR